jgi:hypothetical protein
MNLLTFPKSCIGLSNTARISEADLLCTFATNAEHIKNPTPSVLDPAREENDILKRKELLKRGRNKITNVRERNNPPVDPTSKRVPGQTYTHL